MFTHACSTTHHTSENERDEKKRNGSSLSALQEGAFKTQAQPQMLQLEGDGVFPKLVAGNKGRTAPLCAPDPSSHGNEAARAIAPACCIKSMRKWLPTEQSLGRAWARLAVCLAMEVFGKLEAALGMHVFVMAAVCCHGCAPPCALHRLAHGRMFCSRVLLPAQALWFQSALSVCQNVLLGAPA
eukprot:1155830-Pelagomonas_calceolata.AAC.3